MIHNNYEIIKHKVWFNNKTNQTASIFGAVPYSNDIQKSDWIIQERGFTIYNKKLNITGTGNKPFTTYFQALNWINERGV